MQKDQKHHVRYCEIQPPNYPVQQGKQLERLDKMLEHSKLRLASTVRLEKEYKRLVDSIIRNFNLPDKDANRHPR